MTKQSQSNLAQPKNLLREFVNLLGKISDPKTPPTFEDFAGYKSLRDGLKTQLQPSSSEAQDPKTLSENAFKAIASSFVDGLDRKMNIGPDQENFTTEQLDFFKPFSKAINDCVSEFSSSEEKEVNPNAALKNIQDKNPDPNLAEAFKDAAKAVYGLFRSVVKFLFGINLPDLDDEKKMQERSEKMMEEMLKFFKLFKGEEKNQAQTRNYERAEPENSQLENADNLETKAPEDFEVENSDEKNLSAEENVPTQNTRFKDSKSDSRTRDSFVAAPSYKTMDHPSEAKFREFVNKQNPNLSPDEVSKVVGTMLRADHQIGFMNRMSDGFTPSITASPQDLLDIALKRLENGTHYDGGEPFLLNKEELELISNPKSNLENDGESKSEMEHKNPSLDGILEDLTGNINEAQSNLEQYRGLLAGFARKNQEQQVKSAEPNPAQEVEPQQTNSESYWRQRVSQPQQQGLQQANRS